MFSSVYSGGLHGIDGYRIQVEADVSDGLPGFSMVGYLASEVKEAEQRVKAAIKNAGFHLEAKKVTVNLSPANVRKAGTAYDLPVAVAILAAYGRLDASAFRDGAFMGELGLDGRCKPIRGVLSLVLAMKEAGLRRCFLPAANVREGLAVEGIDIVRVEDLRQLAELLAHPETLACVSRDSLQREEATFGYEVDFSEIHGQQMVRRATEVAVAGQHNILYMGPPGSGKSMVARRIPTIMPSLSKEEQMEITKIYSVCGMLPAGSALVSTRPFRSPHHTISPQAMTGGGRVPRPGEISLASRGVLFLDELPEFQKSTLEILRQPMEERKVTISRVHGAAEFPAQFMLAVALNPCPCGYYPDERCNCTEGQIRHYLGRISRPLLDRIDVCVEAELVSYADLQKAEPGESSARIRVRVERAREIQRRRFRGRNIFFNSQMGAQDIRQFCRLASEDDVLMQRIFHQMQLSARGCHRILRVARTIADLDGAEQIGRLHLCEAVSYRSLEEKYWGRSRNDGSMYGSSGTLF